MFLRSEVLLNASSFSSDKFNTNSDRQKDIVHKFLGIFFGREPWIILQIVISNSRRSLRGASISNTWPMSQYFTE